MPTQTLSAAATHMPHDVHVGVGGFLIAGLAAVLFLATAFFTYEAPATYSKIHEPAYAATLDRRW